MIGVPVPGISTIGLGRSSVYGRRREPWPPARTTACVGYECGAPVMVRTLCGASGGHWAEATPEAKAVSQTGRENVWARCAAPPYLATAARPRARAMEAQCLAS